MKKAQASSSSIAVLVVLIALFLVVYILLLPAEDRQSLLNEGSLSDSNPSSTDYVSSSIILQESPGNLQDTSGEKFTKNFESCFRGKIKN